MTEKSTALFSSARQQPLWKSLCKDSIPQVVSKQDYLNRQVLLQGLEALVHNGTYTPSPPLYWISSHKGNGVTRFSPLFSIQDYAVYYACVDAIDELLATQWVEGTFGGWAFGGSRRSMEERDAERLIYDTYGLPTAEYVPMASFYKHAWVKQWNDFRKLTNVYCDRYPEATVITLDIANFYDSVELSRLERALRRTAGEKLVAIEILMFFLQYWNRERNKYAPSSKGIPQDASGDCSRILANFYLNPFDTRFKTSELCR